MVFKAALFSHLVRPIILQAVHTAVLRIRPLRTRNLLGTEEYGVVEYDAYAVSSPGFTRGPVYVRCGTLLERY